MKKQVLCILKEHPKKRIEIKELVTQLKHHEINIHTEPELNKDFINLIRSLVGKGILVPLKKANPLLEYEGIPHKYEINLNCFEYPKSTLSSSELVSYHHKIDMSYYVKHPAEYYGNEKYIRRIDLLLKEKNSPTLTANERSYLIFDDEKALTLPEGATVYFLTDKNTHKVSDMKVNQHVAYTVDDDNVQVMEITGIQMQGRASLVTDEKEIGKVLKLMSEKYPFMADLPPNPDIIFFKVEPVEAYYLDYSRGFNHRDFVTY